MCLAESIVRQSKYRVFIPETVRMVKQGSGRLSRLLLIFTVLFWACRPSLADEANAENGSSLYLLSLLPFPAEPGASLSPSFDRGPDLLPAVRLALSDVNKRQDLLRGYKLETIVDDGGCDIISTTYVSFARHVLGSVVSDKENDEPPSNTGPENNNIVSILGPICSTSSLVVSELVSRPEIALINLHLGGFLLPQEGTGQRYSFGMRAPDSQLNGALFALMEILSWNKIAVLYDSNSAFYQDLYEEFGIGLTRLALGKIELTRIISSSNDIPQSITAIKDSTLRVIVLFLGPELTSSVLALAESDSVLFPNYQWVHIAVSLSEIKQEFAGTVASVGDGVINRALKGALVVQNRLTTVNLNGSTDIGISYADFSKQYSALLQEGNQNPSCGYANLTYSVYGGLLYDMVWALALALNSSLKVLEERNLSLSRYMHGMPDITDVLSEQMLNLEFHGVSGHVDFRQGDGFSSRPIAIHRVTSEGGGEVLMAEYLSENLTILASAQLAQVLPDNFPHFNQRIHLAAAILSFLITLLQLVLIISTHVATCVFRKRRSVKASSNRLNHFIFAGCYLVIITIILNILLKAFIYNDRKGVGIVCQAIWPWALSMGTTLVFGTISVRTWRIYRIFIHYLDPGPLVSDTALTVMLCGMLAVDLIIAITWTALDPITAVIVSSQQVDNNGQITIKQGSMCTSDYLPIWLIVIMCYKTLLLVTMLTLAILTRKVKNKDFTTLNLRIISYLMAIAVGLGFSLYYFLFFLNVEEHIDFIFLVVLLNLVVFLCFSLVLFPPLLPILKSKWNDSVGRKQTFPNKHFVRVHNQYSSDSLS